MTRRSFTSAGQVYGCACLARQLLPASPRFVIGCCDHHLTAAGSCTQAAGRVIILCMRTAASHLNHKAPSTARSKAATRAAMYPCHKPLLGLLLCRPYFAAQASSQFAGYEQAQPHGRPTCLRHARRISPACGPRPLTRALPRAMDKWDERQAHCIGSLSVMQQRSQAASQRWETGGFTAPHSAWPWSQGVTLAVKAARKRCNGSAAQPSVRGAWSPRQARAGRGRASSQPRTITAAAGRAAELAVCPMAAQLGQLASEDTLFRLQRPPHAWSLLSSASPRRPPTRFRRTLPLATRLAADWIVDCMSSSSVICGVPGAPARRTRAGQGRLTTYQHPLLPIQLLGAY
jgi:hypothetical protein